MPRDVDITFGGDTRPLNAALAQVRETGARAQKDLSSGLAAAFAVGGIIAFSTKLLAVADHLDDLSKQFGVSSTILQKWGNAAETSGTSLESVALAFSKLEIARSKALGGNEGLTKSFSALDVTIEDLKNLSPDEIMLKLGASSLNAADLVKLLGKNAGELRPLLEGIANGSIKLGDAWSEGVNQSLADANDTFKELGQTATIVGGKVLGFVVNSWKEGVNSMVVSLLVGRELIVGSFDAIKKAMQFDFKGARFAITSSVASAKDQLDTGLRTAGEIWTGNHEKSSLIGRGGGDQSTDQFGNPTGGGKSTADASKLISLKEKLASLEKQSYLDSLSKTQRLHELEQQRLKLQTDITGKMYYGTLTEEEHAQKAIEIYGINKEIAQTEKEIAGDKRKTAEAATKHREELVQAAEKQAELAAKAAEEKQLRLAALGIAQQDSLILRAELEGHHEVAEQLRIHFDFQNKINAARKSGNEALAKELESQRAITHEIENRRKAEERNAKNDAQRQENVNNLAGYSIEDLLQLALLNAPPDGESYNSGPAGGPSFQEQLRAGAFRSTYINPRPAGYNPGFAQSGPERSGGSLGRSDILAQLQTLAANRPNFVNRTEPSAIEPILREQLVELRELNGYIRPMPGGH